MFSVQIKISLVNWLNNVKNAVKYEYIIKKNYYIYNIYIMIMYYTFYICKMVKGFIWICSFVNVYMTEKFKV